jgi:precorrin-6B methylase 2
MSTSAAPRSRRRTSTTNPATAPGERIQVDAAARAALVDRLIADAARTGRMPLPARTSQRYVRTPDEVADVLCTASHHDLPWLPPGSRVVEPSAGDGSLVAAILRANPHVVVTAVEPDSVRAAVCATTAAAAQQPVQIEVSTFEQYATAAIRGGIGFDAIVMNPPFALPGQADVWFEHVRLAWQLLRPGARLVAVVPNGFTFRSSNTRREARQFIEHHGAHEPLPAGAFTPSGTTVSTRVARLTKPLPTGNADSVLRVDADRDPVRVRVRVPQLTAAAVADMPVQVWRCAFTSGDRVLRFCGRCLRCGWLLWGFDDGENDPRGILGPFSAGLSLNPDDYGLTGPAIGLCPACGATGAGRDGAAAEARIHWAPPAALAAS